MNAAKLLVVDDDLDDIILMNECMLEAGFTNVQYMNLPQRVMDYLDTLPAEDLPKVIISDQSMPVLTGFDLLSALRSHPRYKNIKFILLSTSALNWEKEKGAILGATDYLQKPLIFKEYQLIVKRVRELVEE